jgi:membrane protease YdiL (CAAX protease family)
VLSEKQWRGEVVMQFVALQLACFCSGAIIIGLFHKFGINGFKRPEDFGAALVATLCFQGATWILIPIFLRQHQIRWREAFGFCGPRLLQTLLVAVGVVIVILPVALSLEKLSVFILNKIGWPLEDQAAVQLFTGAKTWWARVYFGVFAVLIAPVAEEFIFRGMLFPFVKRLGYPRLAWFGVSALFALIHFDVAIFAPLFALALALTWLYEFTDNLLAPIVAHSLFNAANLVVLISQNQ